VIRKTLKMLRVSLCVSSPHSNQTITSAPPSDKLQRLMRDQRAPLANRLATRPAPEAKIESNAIPIATSATLAALDIRLGWIAWIVSAGQTQKVMIKLFTTIMAADAFGLSGVMILRRRACASRSALEQTVHRPRARANAMWYLKARKARQDLP